MMRQPNENLQERTRRRGFFSPGRGRTAAGGEPDAEVHVNGRGFTLVELVIVVAIVGILAAAALPLARWSVKRQREYQLQERLRVLRIALDRYHDMALAGLIESDPQTNGWPRSLEALVEGVELQGEVPEIVPAVAGEFAATGLGLVGGFAGGGGGPGGAGATQESVAVAMDGTRVSLLGAGSMRLDAQSGRLTIQPRGGGPVSLQLGGSGQQRGAQGGGPPGADQSGPPGSRFGSQGGTLFGARRGGFGPGARGDARGDARRPPVGPDGQPLKIVFLRRIPVDPFTGEADWGLRCYGEEPDDNMWCGRNVFDVYSKHRGRGINGIPYREW